MRYFAVTYATHIERLYNLFFKDLAALDLLWRVLGRNITGRLFLAVEKPTKKALFGCSMCGACILTHTGMSCPMNCPKNIRNGPCGGVLPNDQCEVRPEMRCVWVEAWRGSHNLGNPNSLLMLQPALDHRHQGRSSWLVELERRRAERSAS